MTNPVDLRELEPPEPLLRILEAIGEPDPGQHVFLLAREPKPIYNMLADAGWRHRARMNESGCELTVFRAAPGDLRFP